MILQLRRVRQRLGLSLTKLTVMTGISTADLSLLERGGRPPFPAWRRRIALALGTPEQELFRPVDQAEPEDTHFTNDEPPDEVA
jgi:transcriptional regulator with XRE-family HTH domain